MAGRWGLRVLSPVTVMESGISLLCSKLNRDTGRPTVTLHLNSPHPPLAHCPRIRDPYPGTPLFPSTLYFPYIGFSHLKPSLLTTSPRHISFPPYSSTKSHLGPLYPCPSQSPSLHLPAAHTSMRLTQDPSLEDPHPITLLPNPV